MQGTKLHVTLVLRLAPESEVVHSAPAHNLTVVAVTIKHHQSTFQPGPMTTHLISARLLRLTTFRAVPDDKRGGRHAALVVE